MRTASVERKSATISVRDGSPISINGSPTGTTDSLSRKRFRITPLTGATISTARPAGLGACRRARASCSSYSVRDTANSAALRASSPVATAVSAASRLSAAMAPAFINSCWRCSVVRARINSAVARSSWARACPTAARDASTAASSSPRVRGSSSGASAVVSRATIVLPLTTGSPGSSSMRCRRPETGADTTNLSRTRVSPSSSSVTCIGPRSTEATPTSIDSGHIAMTTIARTITVPAMRRLFLRNRMLFADLEDRHEVQLIELAPDHQAREDGRSDDAQERQRDRLPRDVEREPVHLAVDHADDGRRKTVPEEAADRQCHECQQRELAHQDERDFRAGEAEDAQAGQLAAPLRQRDARGVVNDAEGDDAGEDQVDEDRDAHVGGHDVAKTLKDDSLESGPGNRRRGLQFRRQPHFLR